MRRQINRPLRIENHTLNQLVNQRSRHYRPNGCRKIDPHHDKPFVKELTHDVDLSSTDRTFDADFKLPAAQSISETAVQVDAQQDIQRQNRRFFRFGGVEHFLSGLLLIIRV